MARRSDHSREELEELILAEAHALMAEVGYARFSAREVAKRIGYSVGTIYNLFGSNDRLILAINSRTFLLWAKEVRDLLARDPADRIAVMVEGYFRFAAEHPNLWMAIYDHRLPAGTELPERYRRERGDLTGILQQEIGRVLPGVAADQVAALARSLIATVHGHCLLALNGTFALLGEAHPQEAALARVREALAAAGKADR